MAIFGLMLWSLGKPLGIILMLITSRVEWHKLQSHMVNASKFTVLCLQPCIKAYIEAYAFSRPCVICLYIGLCAFKG